MKRSTLYEWTLADFERDAQKYMASLPLEHFMESTPQSRQREVTSSSFALVNQRNPRFHYFGELMMHRKKEGAIVLRVVPDNMVVVGDIRDRQRSSYPVDLEAEPVFWTLEYVSESNKRKDYVDNFQKYETDFRVPYHLIFDPEEQDLQFYRHNGSRYVILEPNDKGRLAVPEVEMEVAILDRWVRFWYKGELLPLPGELQVQVLRQNAMLAQLDATIRERDDAIRQQDDAIRQREEQLEVQRQRELSFVAVLRPLVEAKAQVAGRADILTQLPTTTNPQQLTLWLAELG